MKFDPTSANNLNFTCKSPNRQDFISKITKSPLFFEVNPHHHTFLESPNHQLFLVQITKSPFFLGKSPSPHLLGITKSPTFFCPNHQFFLPKSPITKKTCPTPPVIERYKVFKLQSFENIVSGFGLKWCRLILENFSKISRFWI